MTPCKKLGYKVGDRFVVVGEETTFPTGATVELKRDDGTSVPEFRGIGVRAKDGDDWAFMFLENVEKIQESNMQTERVTLQPGDYVSTEGMTEAQYHAVAEGAKATTEGDKF